MEETKGTILVVDDEAPIRMIAKSILKRLGYSALLAEDGMEALDIYKEHYLSIDLVILDMVMPVLSGIDCFERMREIREDVKAIIISGCVEEKDAEELHKKGIQGFLPKPYEISSLKELLENLLS